VNNTAVQGMRLKTNSSNVFWGETAAAHALMMPQWDKRLRTKSDLIYSID
jgi:hypothetical protein